jgi:hypothetical protein
VGFAKVDLVPSPNSHVALVEYKEVLVKITSKGEQELKESFTVNAAFAVCTFM